MTGVSPTLPEAHRPQHKAATSPGHAGKASLAQTCQGAGTCGQPAHGWASLLRAHSHEAVLLCKCFPKSLVLVHETQLKEGNMKPDTQTWATNPHLHPGHRGH